MNVTAMPKVRTVLAFEFSGTPTECRRYWLVVENGLVDMCLRNPGYEVDLTIRSNIRRFIEAWRGLRDLRKEIVSGHIKVEGKMEYRRALPDWLRGSALGSFERSHSGPEREHFCASHSVTAK